MSHVALWLIDGSDDAPRDAARSCTSGPPSAVDNHVHGALAIERSAISMRGEEETVGLVKHSEANLIFPASDVVENAGSEPRACVNVTACRTREQPKGSEYVTGSPFAKP